MIAVLTDKGASIGTGVPKYFVKDSDFEELVKNQDLAQQLYKELGETTVLIGTLGRDYGDGVYRDSTIDDIDKFEIRGVGFYEKI